MNLIKIMFQRLELILDLDLFVTMVKRLNYRYGTLQDKKGTRL